MMPATRSKGYYRMGRGNQTVHPDKAWLQHGNEHHVWPYRTFFYMTLGDSLEIITSSVNTRGNTYSKQVSLNMQARLTFLSRT